MGGVGLRLRSAMQDLFLVFSHHGTLDLTRLDRHRPYETAAHEHVEHYGRLDEEGALQAIALLEHSIQRTQNECANACAAHCYSDR